MKSILNRFFIDGFGGMAYGLFATFILGTAFQQAGALLHGNGGTLLVQMGTLAVSLTGAGIGIAVSSRLQESPSSAVSAAVAGMAGAYGQELAKGTLFAEDGALFLSGPGEPLCAFLAAFTAIELSRLIMGKIRLDCVLAPLAGISGGSLVGIYAGIPISQIMKYLGSWITWGTQQQPLVMGMTVAVLMGMAAVLPLNAVALSVMLNLSGLAAGAATIGCCCSMAGFAAAGYNENGVSGLLTLGLGTPMLEFPNILRRPLIWLPCILSSAILGPVGTVFAKMSNTAVGAGIGSSAFMGQILTWQTMLPDHEPAILFFKIALLHFLLPGLLTLGIAKGMRKLNLIKPQDMALDI